MLQKMFQFWYRKVHSISTINNKYIKVLNPTRRIGFKEGETVLDAMLRNSIEIPHSCGKMGTCGTCRVLLTVKSIHPDRTDIEKCFIKNRNFAENEYLSCQLIASNEFQIKIP